MLQFKIIPILYLLNYLSTVSSNEDAEARNIVGVTTGRQQCREHFTCLSPDRTLENLQYLKVNSLVPNWYEMCNCDHYCHIFGDCCSDAPVLKELETDEWSFVKIRLGKTQFMTLLRSKCSSKWNDTVIRMKCEQTNQALYLEYLMPEIEHLLFVTPNDEFKNWHVTGKESLITYRNIYCAKCNYDEDVEAWTQRLRCKTAADKETMINGKDYSHKCSVVAHQQTPEIIGREKLKRTPLQTKVWSQCSLGWYKLNLLQSPSKVLDIIKRCMIYYEPVVVQEAKSGKFLIFKNKYCAFCNDFEENHLQCPQQSIDQMTQMPVSFNVMTSFDTNTTRGSQIDAAVNNMTCPPESVFNPLIRNCQGLRHIVPANELANLSPILDKPSLASSIGLVRDPPNSSSSLKLFSLFFLSFFILFIIHF